MRVLVPRAYVCWLVHAVVHASGKAERKNTPDPCVARDEFCAQVLGLVFESEQCAVGEKPRGKWYNVQRSTFFRRVTLEVEQIRSQQTQSDQVKQ